MSTEVNCTAEEKQLAKEVIKYLSENGICLSWNFYEDTPPSKEVREFLLDYFDLENAEYLVAEDVIGSMEFRWSLDEEENG